MSDNALPLKRMESAPRGSKKGWQTVGGQVSPEVFRVFDAALLEQSMQQTDAVREAVEEWLAKRGYSIPTVTPS